MTESFDQNDLNLISARIAANAAAKAAVEVSKEAAIMQERILGDIRALNIAVTSSHEIFRTTCERIENSLARGGERMQKIEEEQTLCSKNGAVMFKSLESLDKSVEKLEKSKSYFITAIIGSYLAGITGKFWK